MNEGSACYPGGFKGKVYNDDNVCQISAGTTQGNRIKTPSLSKCLLQEEAKKGTRRGKTSIESCCATTLTDGLVCKKTRARTLGETAEKPAAQFTEAGGEKRKRKPVGQVESGGVRRGKRQMGKVGGKKQQLGYPRLSARLQGGKEPLQGGKKRNAEMRWEQAEQPQKYSLKLGKKKKKKLTIQNNRKIVRTRVYQKKDTSTNEGGRGTKTIIGLHGRATFTQMNTGEKR